MQAEKPHHGEKERPLEPRPQARGGVFPCKKAIHNLWRSFLRLFFHLLYNEFAWCYDYVAWIVSRGQWQAWGEGALPHVTGDCVLELGHGPGHLLAKLSQRGFAPVGLDVSPFMARYAKRRLRNHGLGVGLIRARAQRLPFHRDSFDSVVATFPTEFITHPRTLKEVARVLRPRGHLVVVLGARFRGKGLTSRFMRWLYRITGQDPQASEALMTCMKHVGLSPRLTSEKIGDTAVTLLVAERE